MLYFASLYNFRVQGVNLGASTSTSSQPQPPTNTFPALYVLPEFPEYLVQKLENQREAIKSDENITNQITRILMEDIQQYYPSDQL